MVLYKQNARSLWFDMAVAEPGLWYKEFKYFSSWIGGREKLIRENVKYIWLYLYFLKYIQLNPIYIF
jgi:hypothetical protein